MKLYFVLLTLSITIAHLLSYNNFLPPLGANPDTVTVSGYSAGGYMAQMLHVIYSKTIKGCGWVGSGPYMAGL